MSFTANHFKAAQQAAGEVMPCLDRRRIDPKVQRPILLHH